MSYKVLPKSVSELHEVMRELPEFENFSYKCAFEGFMKKIEQIDSFNSVNKYKVVFIGEPGKGKTTAICNWLNLLKKNKENEKRVDTITLLATASGRTTVAEVHIKQISDTSKIRMEYMPIEQQKEYIKEYCAYYFSRCFDMENDDIDDPSDDCKENIHLEIDRVIRNMASIENFPSGSSERAKEKQSKIISFMKRFSDVASFYEYVLEKINLEERQCSVITYTGNISFEKWLSNTFKEINDGKRADCSIVSKIYIDICYRDLFLNLPDYIDEIVDTIGLDSSVRIDLRELMLAEDTICFLMDDLKNVPSQNIRSLIKGTFLSDWDEYCICKTSIFVRSPSGELAAVNEADGDPDAGMEIKAMELDRRVEADKIPYKMDNTLFLDSCAAYVYESERTTELDENGNPIISKLTGKPKVKITQVIERYESDVALEYSQGVTNKINMVINQLKNQLQEDADKIRMEVENLLELERKFKNTEADNELIEVKEKIIEKRSSALSRFRDSDVIEAILSKTIDGIHWRTIKKMNSLYGGYERWHTDIYTQIMQAGRECFSRVIKPYSTEIRQILIDVRNEDARSITAGYLNQYNSMVKKSIERIGQQFIEWALDDGFAPQSDLNRFWREVNKISGRGYKLRVREKYEEVVYKYRDILADMIINEVEKIIDKLIGLFPED